MTGTFLYSPLIERFSNNSKPSIKGILTSEIITSGMFLAESQEKASIPLFLVTTLYLLCKRFLKSQRIEGSSSITSTFFIQLSNYQNHLSINDADNRKNMIFIVTIHDDWR